jgi:hypothetical protein
MKIIKGFDNYLIDKDGYVFSVNKGKTKRIKGTITNQGHNRVMLFKNSKPYAKMVHRLVLETYVGECPKGQEACHADGNPLNNTLSNLRWDDHYGNARDKMRHSKENI